MLTLKKKTRHFITFKGRNVRTVERKTKKQYLKTGHKNSTEGKQRTTSVEN